MNNKLGISGKIAAAFQASAMTPLLALVALLLGLMAIVVTPKKKSLRLMLPLQMCLFLFLEQLPEK